jgi:superfamily II DNA helicase RecQ
MRPQNAYCITLVSRNSFGTKNFKRKIVAMVVDEAHVIEAWKVGFQKEYGELETLKIIMGNWLALARQKPTTWKKY